MPYCRKCGFNMEELLEECPSCGEKLNEERKPFPARVSNILKDEPETEAAPGEEISEKKSAPNKKKLIIIIAAAVLILAAAAYILIRLSSASVSILYNGEKVNRLPVDAGVEDEIVLTADANHLSGKLEWKSSDSSVLRITETEGNSCTIKLKRDGKAVITVSAGNASASVKIEVTGCRPVRGD